MPISRSRYEPTEETHRTTNFEIFFDLVFVFALTRIVEFMAETPTAVTMVRGLILILLLWFSWSAYAWLGNEARADVGLVRTGTLAAMAALFVAALAIPDAWQQDRGPLPAALVLAVAYLAVRVLHISLYLYVSRSPQLTRTLRLSAIPLALAWIPFVVGALLGGTAQTALWAAAFLIDVGGGRVASGFSPWQLRSVSHFTERHRLVIIIAIGESLISIGLGAGAELVTWWVLLAALLGFVVTVCLWRLYFDRFAPAIEHVVATVPRARRGTIASDAFSLAHLPMIAGILYIALGVEQVLAVLMHEGSASRSPGLGLPGVVALYGGGALYLVGRALCLRLTAGRTALPPIAGAVALVLLIAPARLLPALSALALLVVALLVQCAVERRSGTLAAPPAVEPAR
ncbi:low temperature requirement protein A [Micromonospora sp. 15K316]|uniref:low temperature requirement protein A n=1 Tax=Micromonospora sp. 15K316 TaxID=2530376 RepID=UPI00104388C9|nr:low temperature requirement protein A [Micromonospora sp. 15K316]TDC26458.1 low temperature requirement protein A [Micromonospora sp. 15K316]